MTQTMANLTETAYYTRRSINWLILAIICYFILRIFWSVFVVVWLTIFPPKPPPPNHRFGKLPALSFPKQATPSAGLTFQLQSIEGSVPRASESATVYFMPKSAPNLLALSRTQDFAERLGFDPTPVAETRNIYRFNDPDYPLRTLRYDIVSNNFIVRYDFAQDTGIFVNANLPLDDVAKAESKSILQTYRLYSDDLIHGSTRITYLKLSGDRFTKTTSQSKSDAIRIDYFRADISGMHLFTPDPDQGPVSFVYSGSNNAKKKMLQFAYTYWPIDTQTTGTYALKTSSQAWSELQSGTGFIARYPSTGSSAIVRQVYLGYYDNFDPQSYLQPVFVFEGDFGFMSFVPAVSPEWVEK
jgi:hypothetical protein